LREGQTAKRLTTISRTMVEEFARISGDHNPIHLDDQAAARSRFGKRVAHGLLVASTISGVLAEDLPGPGTIYLSQSLRFTAPVFIGDRILTRVTAIQATGDRTWEMSTDCINDAGDFVIQGTASVLLDTTEPAMGL
jgi:3-hydroxybutyryl-CoA dehydratase